MKYDNYLFKDYITDDYFIQWVLRPDVDSNYFWEEWLSQNPHKWEEINKAREYVLALNKDESKWTTDESKNVWSNIEKSIARIDQKEENYAQRKFISDRQKSSPYFIRVAATLLIILTASLAIRYYYGESQMLIRQTGYGEIKEILLPDSTFVTLNSNSQITYAENMDQEAVRTVQLKGEAYFSVSHTSDHRKFVVHTINLDVEVLGTEFNVNTRRDQTQVVLNAGKVKIAAELEKDTTQMVLEPGEMVKLATEEKTIVRRQVDPYHYSSWKDRKLILDDTPISDIAKKIEDNYGVKIIISDTELSNRKVTGTILSDNLDVLLKALSTTSDIEVVRERNHIILKNK